MMLVHRLYEPLPCFVCGKELESIFPAPETDEVVDFDHPGRAVKFSSPGNYGSAVFDEDDGSLLHLNICDACLVERHDRVWLSRHIEQPPIQVTGQFWQPPA